MDTAQQVLENYLQLPGTRASWLYLNPDRVWGHFIQVAGSATDFTISSSGQTDVSGEVKFLGSGVGGSRGHGENVSVTYKVVDPLVMALLVRAYLSQQGLVGNPCHAKPGELVQLVAPGQLSHPDLTGTEAILTSYYGPATATVVEETRVRQEAGAKFIFADAKLAAVAFGGTECPIASVIDIRWINANWPTSYNGGLATSVLSAKSNPLAGTSGSLRRCTSGGKAIRSCKSGVPIGGSQRSSSSG